MITGEMSWYLSFSHTSRNSRNAIKKQREHVKANWKLHKNNQKDDQNNIQNESGERIQHNYFNTKLSNKGEVHWERMPDGASGKTYDISRASTRPHPFQPFVKKSSAKLTPEQPVRIQYRNVVVLPPER
jgi:hypothetical protein